jgi:hypothetical protein
MWLCCFFLQVAVGTAVVVREISSNEPIIALQTDEHPGYVTRVEWCRSLYLNRDNPPDIHNCKAPGLMHLVLYPNEKRRYIKSESKMMLVDRADLGGVDTEHQFNIIVQSRDTNGVLYETIYRFNPISHPPPPTPPPPSNSPTISPDTTTPFFAMAGTNPKEQPRTWVNALIVLCVGLAAVAGLAFVLYKRGFGEKFFPKRLQTYGGGYEFTSIPIEKDFVSIESEQDILKKLGIGANEAFEEI